MTSNATIRDEHTSRKKKVAAITTGMVLVGGAAYAYWTANGTGTGLGSTLSGVTALTAVQRSTVSDLQPGTAPQALSGDFNNPNDGPIYVATVTASIASVVKAGGAPAGPCDATDYTLSNATMTVNAEVAPGMAVGGWSGASIEFHNKPSTNQDGCKGATVNLAYAIS